MFSPKFRSRILVVTLLSCLSTLTFAVTENEGLLSEKFLQAQTLANQGNIEQAIRVYLSLIRSNPQFPEVYNNLAALYLKQNNPKEAKHILEQGIYAHKGYGVLYESLTTINVAMAREAYSKALQIELKPSVIRIASLSLSTDKPQVSDNTIIISKVEAPAIEKKLPIEPKKIIQPEPPKTIVQPEPAKTLVKTKPVEKVKRVSMTTTEVQNPNSLEKVLQAWSSAWSAQAIDMYLSFYHNQYRPSNGLSRENWVNSRRMRLKKPRWIKVSFSNLKVKKQTRTQAVVLFKQKYQSNKFRDVSYKQVVFLNTDDGWRIYREKSY